MSERIDRRIGGSGLLLATLVIMLVLAAGAGSYFWLRGSTRSGAAAPLPEQILPVQPLRSDEPLTLTAFEPGNGILSPAAVAVKRQPDTEGQAREALAEVLRQMRAAREGVLGELALRAFFLDEAGTGYVDLILPEGGIRASAAEEILALHAIVNLLTHNFYEIRQVRFLIDGREEQTLAGHIDLSRKFTKRMDMVKQ
jgi:hypothetical protein